MDLKAIIAARQAEADGLIARRDALRTEGETILAKIEAEQRTDLSETERSRQLEIVTERASLATQIETVQAEVDALRKDAEDEDRITRAQAERKPAAPTPGLRVGAEARTYSKEQDRTGKQFAIDVARASLFGDLEARDRLSRHMDEERVERGVVVERAAGTGAFTGLVVPQYLVDQYAPAAKAGRPTIDAMRAHELPPTGMTVYLGKTTTSTSVAVQSSENTSVSETNFDDTLVTVPVRTSAGSQTVSRQAAERGVGVEDTVIDDLIRTLYTNQDTTVLTEATYGLTVVATGITYTDTDPTAAELYPKLIQASVAVETALLDQHAGDTIAIMHPRRWGWAQTQLTSTWPMFGQPGVAPQLGGTNFGERYGAGFRGVLPNGTAVVVDGNVGTAYGTNEDEIYFISQSESHFWEDPNAPVLIRADISAKSLGIDLVVYAYYAYTFTRRSHAQKIGGSGLIAPTW